VLEKKTKAREEEKKKNKKAGKNRFEL